MNPVVRLGWLSSMPEATGDASYPLDAIILGIGATASEIIYTLDGLLCDPGIEVRCTVLLSDAAVDQAIVRRLQHEYGADARVDVSAAAPSTSNTGSQFRLTIPAGWRPGNLGHMIGQMRSASHGLRSILFPDGRTARCEDIALFDRAHCARMPGEDVDDAVDRVSGSWWSDGIELGFRRHGPRP